MGDQIIDAAMARGLHADACRDHTLVAWVVMHDPPEYPNRFIARLMTSAPATYVLIADSLAEVQALLPAGLVRYGRQSFHPPDVVEIWFAEEAMTSASANQLEDRTFLPINSFSIAQSSAVCSLSNPLWVLSS